MLYVTTRNKYDTYTVFHANLSDRGPDGGLYQPFRMPAFDQEELSALTKESFCGRLAKILNIFFNAQLTPWDVELCCGKNPAALTSVSHRLLVAEMWHNHDLDYARLECRLAARICGYEEKDRKPVSWVGIAIRIAMLFGVYAQLRETGVADSQTTLDIAAASDDFAAPMAVWYARKMGLPVGNIICSHKDASVWNLLHQGQVRTDGGMPENMERLVCGTLGVEENLRYCEACDKGQMYTVLPGALETLREGMYATVTSQERLNGVIPNVYRTGGYIMGPQTALAYSGLQDYRAKTGESRLALLISDRSPVCDSKAVAACMDMTEQELLKKLGE